MEGKMKGEDFFVKLGGHDLRNSGEFYEVVEATPHENYRTWRRYNDIALFKLAKKIDFSNPNVRPVCFPSEDMDKQDLTGQNATVIGWGTTSFGGDIAKNLMEVQVPIVSNEECDKSYSSVEGSAVSYPEGINHNFICAGAPEGGKDSCQGDSGGPLLYQVDNVWYQVGVVSFGYKCAEKGYPGVYTRTSHFVKWLGSHTDDTRKKTSRKG
jgi:secreted trypsin-like serine protease